MSKPKLPPPRLNSLDEAMPDGCWTGLAGFVIGGGHSLKGFDPERLAGKGKILGCNMAWRWPGCDIAYFKDERLYQREKKAWHGAEKPLRAVDHWGASMPLDSDPKGTYWVKTLSKNGEWGTSLKAGIMRARQTGIGLVNMAEILGCNPIYLLGFDLNAPPQGYQNWHDSYPAAWLPKVQGKHFSNWIKEWEAVKDQIKARIVNLNPDSALTIFEKQKMEEVL